MGLLLGLLTYLGIAAGLVFGMATAVSIFFADGAAVPKQAKTVAPVPPKIASYLERRNEPAPAAKPEPAASPPIMAMTEPTSSIASPAVIRTPGYDASGKPKRSPKAERRAPVREAQAEAPPARSAAVAPGVSQRELSFRIP